MTRKKILISAPFMENKEFLALKGPLASGWLTQGRYVAEFEKKFAKLHGVRYAVATTSCTTALHLALVALGIGHNDEVILPSFTWVATANAVEYVGAKPVFCDVKRETYNIDITKIEQLISPRTKAVIAVHLFGLCADVESLIDICKRRKIYLIEDAACAAGASVGQRKAGTFGAAGCFSFHPRKIITTGEGGICTTNDIALANKLASLRNHGASIPENKRLSGKKPFILPDFNILGFNYRMTDLQAAIGIAQVNKLERLIIERQKWADWYRDKLKAVPWLTLPVVPHGYKHTYQSFVCCLNQESGYKDRDKIMKKLFKCGIECRPGTHAIHTLGYYSKKYGFKNNEYPVSFDLHQNSMAIPLHNRMNLSDYKYVAKNLIGI